MEIQADRRRVVPLPADRRYPAMLPVVMQLVVQRSAELRWVAKPLAVVMSAVEVVMESAVQEPVVPVPVVLVE